MNATGRTERLRSAFAAIRDLPKRMSDRVKKKILGFDQTIAGFRQRRLS